MNYHLRFICLSFISLVFLSSCAELTGSAGSAASLASIKTVAVGNECRDLVRFHQGITAFDNVVKREPSATLSGALTKAVEKGLSSRFQISKVQIPAEYTAKGVGFWNTKPALPAVTGVDAIAVIRTRLIGTSEPAIAMQGFGVNTARLGFGSSGSGFINIEVVLYDARSTQVITNYLFSERAELPGVSWHSEWSEYTPAEKTIIENGLIKAFDMIAVELSQKAAR